MLVLPQRVARPKPVVVPPRPKALPCPPNCPPPSPSPPKPKILAKWLPILSGKEANSSMELEFDLVSGKEALSVPVVEDEDNDHWTNWVDNGLLHDGEQLDLDSGKEALSVSVSGEDEDNDHHDHWNNWVVDNGLLDDGEQLDLDSDSIKEALSVSVSGEDEDNDHHDHWNNWVVVDNGLLDDGEQLDLVSGKEALSATVEDDDHGTNLVDNGLLDDGEPDEYEDIEIDPEAEPQKEDHEELIKETRRVLKLCREQKQQQRPVEEPVDCRQRRRQTRRSRRRGKANARYAEAAEAYGVVFTKVNIMDVRYSQLSCKSTFRCGKPIQHLIEDLCNWKVKLSAPFLTLTVFEDTDSTTGEPILKCADNRRLFALKEYAVSSGKDCLMVNAKVFSQKILNQVHRILNNKDNTDGHHIRLRTGSDDKPQSPKKRKRSSTRTRNRNKQ